MPHNCPACGTVNDDWRPFCTKCSLRLDGARGGVPGTAGSAIEHYTVVGELLPEPEHSPAGKRAGVRATVAVVVIAALAGVGVGGVEIAHHLSKTATTADAPPRHWDARLAPLAKAAERLRGLTFKHPVSARFYSDAAFDKLSTSGVDSPKSRTELARTSAELRALGLAPAGLDLTKTVKTLTSSTLLAFYDPATKRISVRGTSLDVNHDVTIVHELTHALQDQYFDLQKIRPRNAPKGDSAIALVEGDARDVENRYVDSLSKAAHAKYDAEQKRLGVSVRGEVASVPDALVLSEQAPYDLGERFVRALRAVGGSDAVNRAFRDVPHSDWFYSDPVAYLDHAKVTKLARPSLPAGGKFLEDVGEFGNFTLFLTLAERIDAHAALAASDAWRGDHTIFYTQHDTTCVDMDVAGRDTGGVASIESAMRTWSAHMPRNHTAVERVSEHVIELRACDAGARTPALTHKALPAYSLPISRLELLDTFLGAGAPASTSWCAADQVVYTYSAAQLEDPSGKSFSGAQFENRLKGWIRACQASAATS